jgi:delta24(24(1))-sterol reductase
LVKTILGLFLPGVWVKGLPVPTENNIRHDYLCNAASSWYLTLFVVLMNEKFGFVSFSLSELTHNFGRLLTTAIIFSDFLSVLIYIAGIIQKKAIRMSGNFVYDFFMGSYLNPRIGYFDFKMWAEIKVSWVILYLLTLAAAIEQYQIKGSLSYSMILIVAAHFLYCNAIMKGEECVPTTWDIHHEKWGWMLIYWNLAGVPFVYCFHSYYILYNDPQMPAILFYLLLVILVCAYYIWDTSQSQKNRFKMQQKKTLVKRYTFPQFSAGTLKDPLFLTSEKGDVLLVDGWWKYARKVHYTADITMASIWGLSCGITGILPFYYPIFFVIMLHHRAKRDFEKCKQKYKKTWEEYCKRVPYTYFPGLI